MAGIKLKSEADLKLMRPACVIAARVLDEIMAFIRPGLTTRQVDEFAARYERGESSLNLHLLNFLRDWLTNHIEKVDHGYSAWMNDHGVS